MTPFDYFLLSCAFALFLWLLSSVHARRAAARERKYQDEQHSEIMSKLLQGQDNTVNITNLTINYGDADFRELQ